MLSKKVAVLPVTALVCTEGLGADSGFGGRLIHPRLLGELVATETIEEAAVLAVFIGRAARMQVLAESIGTIKPIDPAMAREAHDYRLKSRAVGAAFHYYARRVLRQADGVLD